MKVLVVGGMYCERHRPERDVTQELVMLDVGLCDECIPERNVFIGLESGEVSDVAVAFDRHDLDFDVYVEIIEACMRRISHFDDADRADVHELARRQAQWINEVADQYPEGTPFTRKDGWTLTSHTVRRKAG